MKLTVIGDIHGWHVLHEKVMRQASPTLQLGDCGLKYDYMKAYDADEHKILGGNHDNYPELIKLPHYLGDYGEWNGVFYVRGAWSIDRGARTEGQDWWPEEELSYEQGLKALESYRLAKPLIVVTHEGPPQATALLEGMFGNEKFPNRTGELLEQMLEAHEPKLWVFGHWHESKEIHVPGIKTMFRCLDEAEELLIEVKDE